VTSHSTAGYPNADDVSHTGLDQGAQIVAEFEHHCRAPTGPDPTQGSDLHRQGVGRSVIKRQVPHVHGVGLVKRVGSK
jgi:hypothetical protein